MVKIYLCHYQEAMYSRQIFTLRCSFMEGLVDPAAGSALNRETPVVSSFRICVSYRKSLLPNHTSPEQQTSNNWPQWRYKSLTSMGQPWSSTHRCFLGVLLAHTVVWLLTLPNPALFPSDPQVPVSNKYPTCSISASISRKTNLWQHNTWWGLL